MSNRGFHCAPDEVMELSISPETAQRSDQRISKDRSNYLISLVQRYSQGPNQSIRNWISALTIVGVLAYGWSIREEGALTPEEGTGYYLGIVGGAMMLVLLLYPLRKRLRSLAWLGRVPWWFRMHMLLGILGPILVLFHANFHLGSTNSTVALFSMLTVAMSGLIGRFLYARVHHGLYGRKAVVNEILQDADKFKELVGEDAAGLASLGEALQAYEQRVCGHQSDVISSLYTAFTIKLGEAAMRRRLTRRLRDVINQNGKVYRWGRRERRRRYSEASAHLSNYFLAVRKAAQFGFYERLFALWHVLHLPLFFFLVLTACIHVVAVHLY